MLSQSSIYNSSLKSRMKYSVDTDDILKCRGGKLGLAVRVKFRVGMGAGEGLTSRDALNLHLVLVVLHGVSLILKHPGRSVIALHPSSSFPRRTFPSDRMLRVAKSERFSNQGERVTTVLTADAHTLGHPCPGTGPGPSVTLPSLNSREKGPVRVAKSPGV